MSEPAGQHPGEWIAAYFDGELRGERLEQVRNHLESCAQCQGILEGLKQVSALLQSEPALAQRTPPQQFASSVMLRLPRTQPPPARYRALKAVWKALPLMILAVWAFGQVAVLATSSFFWLWADFLPVGTTLGELQSFLYPGGWAGVVIPVVEVVVFEIAFTLFLAGLMWGWLASWWAMKKA